MTPSGIEPATFRIVGQHLNHVQSMSANHFVGQRATTILWAVSRAALLKVTVAGIPKVHPKTGHEGPEGE
jgi:hypothetical protein